MFLLQTSDLGVRLAAGELLALMYEVGRSVQQDFGYRDRNGVCDLIRELATEGNKHIAKKDLRQQRSSFRDILKTIEVHYYSFLCMGGWKRSTWKPQNTVNLAKVLIVPKFYFSNSENEES